MDLCIAQTFNGPLAQVASDARHLPDVGLFGNSHFMFSDLNNVQVADQL